MRVVVEDVKEEVLYGLSPGILLGVAIDMDDEKFVVLGGADD